MPSVRVTLDRSVVDIDKEVFTKLFRDSVVSDYAPIRKVLDNAESISFTDLRKLARTAEIPYALFFAPLPVVEQQLGLKTAKLMAGFSKKQFSMNSRNTVALADIELIVKNLLQKQHYLAQDESLPSKHPVMGLLKHSRRPVADDAQRLSERLGFSSEDIGRARNRKAAFEQFVQAVESRQIFVGRSAHHYMPQNIPAGARFSGLTVKDKRVPWIFLASGDEGEGSSEPDGRKIFTLALLVVLVAQGTFAPVTYSDHTKEEQRPREYDVTAEFLMPEAEFRRETISDLDDVKRLADRYKVTPSAAVMRVRRLGLLPRQVTADFLDALQAEYDSRPKLGPRRGWKPVNALRAYNGVECSRRMLQLLDAGVLAPAEFTRVMFSNKLGKQDIDDYRRAIAATL